MTVLSGSSAGKMIKNEVRMAAMLIGAAPIGSGRPVELVSPRPGSSSLVTAAEGLTQAASPPGTGSTPRRRGAPSQADRDCRRPGDGATPLRYLDFTHRQPEITMTAGDRDRGQDCRGGWGPPGGLGAAGGAGAGAGRDSIRTVSGDSDGRDQRLEMLHRVVKEHQIAGAVEDVPPV